MDSVETFVVRIFVPAGDERLELTGVVEHSGSGRSERFHGSEALLDVVLHQLELDRCESRPTADQKAESR